jgi:uncharacterized protein YqiB (DUF1249 family)
MAGNDMARRDKGRQLKKQRYQIDLAADMAECEANYARLARLLPDCELHSRTFGLGHAEMSIAVVERCPYTTTLEITQRPQLATAQTLIAKVAACLTVRVYHDARLAEVVEFASRRRVQPRYDYPNPGMHQPDEKSQWNRFLGEWLSHCLQHGFDLRESQTVQL